MIVTIPLLIQKLFPQRVWSGDPEGKSIYLTFDDGPIPELTPWVLRQLNLFNAKATFFCIGDNIKKNIDIFHMIVDEGHALGNHTFHHLNGWKTPTADYFDDTVKTQQIIQRHQRQNNIRTPLFRPPYGKMTAKQAKKLRSKGFKIIMWNILSMDYQKEISAEKCLKNILDNAKAGSIIVFHDSLKAEEKLRWVLPKVLEELQKQDYNFKRL